MDEGRRWRSSGALERCKEEEEGEKARGENEKRTRGLIYRTRRISGRRENRGDKEMDM